MEIICYVTRQPNKRSDIAIYDQFIGFSVLQSLFDKMEIIPDIQELYLSFPENWLNIHELRQLPDRLQTYCPNLKKVIIKTHSEHLLTVLCREQIRVNYAYKTFIKGNESGKLYCNFLETHIWNLTDCVFSIEDCLASAKED